MRWDVDPSSFSALITAKTRVMNQAAERILNQQADALLNAWRAGASGTMYPGMTRPLYSTAYAGDLTRSVVRKGTTLEVEVYHTGKVVGRNGMPFDLVASIETGREPRDIKDGALGGPKAKIAKDGSVYARVPFRHTNVGAKAKSVIASKGALTETNWTPSSRNPFNSVMGPRLTKNITEPVASRSPWASPVATKPLGTHNVGPGQYTWQRHQFAGMKKYGKSGHSQYMTFRTISTKSDPLSWISPRVPPNRIFNSMLVATRPKILANIQAGLNSIT